MIYVQLFFEFFKIGLFSVGGGLATLPFLYELADRYPWFDATMLPNMIAISESTPGPIGVNMATYAGYCAAGILGGIIATIGLVAPSIIIIIIIAKVLNKFKENVYVKSIFYGIRPTVTALIALAGFEVLKVTIFTFNQFMISKQLLDLFNIKALILFAIFLVATKKFKLHPIVFILSGAILGIIFNL
ncbi:MAG: chromate transporter [Cellulosilyticum sp.]|nr:chromate transporter [Cellulosilyticum sp.]